MTTTLNFLNCEDNSLNNIKLLLRYFGERVTLSNKQELEIPIAQAVASCDPSNH